MARDSQREAAGIVGDQRPLAGVKEVSKYLGVPVGTLHQWRHRGSGPKASRVGRHLRYRWSDVEKWLDEQAA